MVYVRSLKVTWSKKLTVNFLSQWCGLRIELCISTFLKFWRKMDKETIKFYIALFDISNKKKKWKDEKEKTWSSYLKMQNRLGQYFELSLKSIPKIFSHLTRSTVNILLLQFLEINVKECSSRLLLHKRFFRLFPGLEIRFLTQNHVFSSFLTP